MRELTTTELDAVSGGDGLIIVPIIVAGNGSQGSHGQNTGVQIGGASYVGNVNNNDTGNNISVSKSSSQKPHYPV